MSYKLICPGCDRYLSSIFQAYADGRPCPCCGSSLQAASEQYYRQLPDPDFDSIPEGREVRKRGDEAGMALDMLHYGNAYCSAPAPDDDGPSKRMPRDSETHEF
jgi:hypothetical protein